MSPEKIAGQESEFFPQRKSSLRAEEDEKEGGDEGEEDLDLERAHREADEIIFKRQAEERRQAEEKISRFQQEQRLKIIDEDYEDRENTYRRF